MGLREKQQLFVRLLGVLFTWVYTHPGWELTLGEGFRADGKGHMAGSLHYQRLAIDLNLFIRDVYITTDHTVYHEIGKFWKSLDPLCQWGGDFASVDLNHFSLAHDGKA